MNNESTGPKPGEEDSWETLAENLFGIDFAKSPDAEDAIAADELLEDLIEEPPVTVESPVEQIAASEELPTGFDEPEPVSELAAVEDAADEGDAVESDSEPSESESEVVAEEEDPYWDALKDWQWDDAESPDSSPPRQPAGRRSPRRDSRPPAAVAKPEPEQVSDYRDEFVGDSDFGAGLLEAEAKSGAAAPTETSPTDSEEPSEPTRKRRRRRRRRGDKPESTSAASAATTSDEKTEPPEAEAEAEAEVDSAVAEQDKESSPERKPRRRRSRRRRAPDTAESATPTVESTAPTPTVESTAPTAESAMADPASDDDLDEPEVEWEDDGGESESHPQDAARHRNLPTWEEAISYLLDPSLVKSERSETEPEKPDAKTAPSGKPESSRPRRRRRRKT